MDLQTSIYLSTILQSQNYILASLVVFWFYDCILTLDQEVSLIHWSQWKKGSTFYIMARYMPAFMLSVHLCMNYLRSEDFVTCNLLHLIWFCAAGLCIAGAEGIFVLRTYGLWGQKKFILGLMLSTIVCLVTLDVIIQTVLSQSGLQLLVSDMGGGCYTLSHDTTAAYDWSLLVVFDLEIIVLTMIRVYWEYRERRYLLLDILLQHNIFYFGTGLALSVINLLLIARLPFNSSNMFATFQVVMHTILVTRMHLQFCNTSQVCHSSESEFSTVSDFQLTQIELQTRSDSNA
ncbi:uncharacterized protein EDB93DRAFT_253220 [Suillus bovinus]|uniref:uncharacterized protein n=1 Tax=Suillus bovinus TaxID=48563 RepID=UPI001B8836FE|nr:uncharacterized protein EDB93DRAFT_253220 [Suillus bovinus]KAG2152578.1 hypothetical protein EDB93DRAFT_253220 [Suillus bovinus]